MAARVAGAGEPQRLLAPQGESGVEHRPSPYLPPGRQPGRRLSADGARTTRPRDILGPLHGLSLRLGTSSRTVSRWRPSGVAAALVQGFLVRPAVTWAGRAPRGAGRLRHRHAGLRRLRPRAERPGPRHGDLRGIVGGHRRTGGPGNHRGHRWRPTSRGRFQGALTSLMSLSAIARAAHLHQRRVQATSPPTPPRSSFPARPSWADRC